MNKIEIIEMRKKRGDGPSKKQNNLDQIIFPIWFHVQMPDNFPYTAAGLMNNPIIGFMHTLLRHSNQWITKIPELREVIAKVNPTIKEIINRIENSSTRSESIGAINQLNHALKNLSQDNFIGKYNLYKLEYLGIFY